MMGALPSRQRLLRASLSFFMSKVFWGTSRAHPTINIVEIAKANDLILIFFILVFERLLQRPHLYLGSHAKFNGGWRVAADLTNGLVDATTKTIKAKADLR